jgi:predicted metal-dependent hydrolase
MSRLRRLTRKVADAALQLALPLFDAGAAPPAVTRQGSRLIRLEGQFVEYSLRRSRRRTIGLVVDERGLAVTAPRWVSQAEIDAVLAERGKWVLGKLVEWREHAARRDRIAIRWEHGAAMPFMGQTLTLRVEPAHAGAACRDGTTLLLALPPGAGSEQIRDTVQGWLQQQARACFAERVERFSRQLGVAPRRWSLSSARTRWGSCSADGSIRLNWRLMHFPDEIIDYVICHELAHLKELNHGPDFWNTVGQLFPDYQRVRGLLRAYPDDVTIS